MFLYDWDSGTGQGTKVEAGFKALGQDLCLGFNVFDNIGLSVTHGSLTLDADAIQFNIALGGTAFGTGVDIPLDIDLPGFGLAVNGGFGVQLDWTYDFGMGLSLNDGFFLTTNDKSGHPDKPELTVNVGAFLDGEPLDNAVVTPLTAEGKLLFFKITATDQDRDTSTPGFQPSGVFGDLSLNIKGDPTTGRLTLNRLLSTSISDLVCLDFGVDATMDLQLALSLDGLQGLPKVKADLVLHWGWDLVHGSSEPDIGLKNFRLDIGTFISDVLKPIASSMIEMWAGNSLDSLATGTVLSARPSPRSATSTVTAWPTWSSGPRRPASRGRRSCTSAPGPAWTPRPPCSRHRTGRITSARKLPSRATTTTTGSATCWSGPARATPLPASCSTSARQRASAPPITRPKRGARHPTAWPAGPI